jgi:uncharacterized protein (DUF305 family)
MAARRLAVGAAVLAFVAVAAARLPLASAETEPYGATARPAACQAGDRPETGLQGEVTSADRASGRSTEGYNCNLSLVGQSQGRGTSWVNQRYGDCAYVGQSLAGNLLSAERGVRVLDVSDPAAPELTALLTSPAMAGDTWESLRVNEARGLLAAVAVGPALGVAFFDVYDIATDCAHPRLLNSIAGTDLSIPANVIGHEGGFSPDGFTYWSSGVVAGALTAIDVTDPALPHVVWAGVTNTGGHGFDISPDGERMYLTSLSGFTTFDISQVQHRAAIPTVTAIGSGTWPGTIAPQHTIAITYRGAPWIIAVDEIGQDGIHFADNSDPAHPIVHPGISLEIERPENAALVAAETSSDSLGLFGYSPHYCSVDRIVEPTALACGYFQSGVRVFDIRDLEHPREVAYFNPPAQEGRGADLAASWHGSLGDLTADWCTSPPAFVGDQLWVTCQDNGFMVLQLAGSTFDAVPTLVLPEAPTAAEETAAAAAPAASGRPGSASLPATGSTSELVLPGLALLAVALVVRGTARRSSGRRSDVLRGAPVILVALLVLPPTSQTDPAVDAGARFAAAMIDHHEQAIAMARAARSDPTASPTVRALAAQIDAEQTVEVELLERWLVDNGEAAPPPANHVAHAADELAASANLNPTAFDDAFLTGMAAHHRAAIPLATAARAEATPEVARIASAMLVDQTIEAVAIDRLVSSPSDTAVVCELFAA